MTSAHPSSVPAPVRHRKSFYRYHSLSIAVFIIILLWLVLYQRSDPNSHLGAFYGNAIADWVGALTILLVTKYLHERGSAESRPFKDAAHTPLGKFLVEHSLSLFFAFLCLVDGWIFFRHDPTSKWGTVAGNLLSQFVQLLALVLLTKKLFEKASGENKR